MCRNERRRTPKGDADDEFTVPCKVRRGDRSAGGHRGRRDSDANGCVRSDRADFDGHRGVERIDDRWQVTQAQRRQVGLEEDRAGRRLRVSPAAYGAFIVHPPVLVGLALAIQPAPVPAELKFVCVLAGGAAASFGLAALGTQVRPIARIIGSGPRAASEVPTVGRSLQASP
jgi:hypothetical protein